jgi:ABC-type multidrug transport system ATPase subunit
LCCNGGVSGLAQDAVPESDAAPDARRRAMGAPVLSLEGVGKAWGERIVLCGADLHLAGGERVVVSGANGAGKTTLLRIAAGLIRPDAGAVAVCGLDVERDRTRYQRAVGFLSAGNSGLYARLKAEHHLDLWSRLALLGVAQRRAAVASVIERFELAPLLGRRVDRLSMGQRQRLRLAAAFLHGPRLVLLDEPATSLDSGGIAMLEAALAEHAQGGGAAIICVPSGWGRMLSCDRSCVLENGLLSAA